MPVCNGDSQTLGCIVASSRAAGFARSLQSVMGMPRIGTNASSDRRIRRNIHARGKFVLSLPMGACSSIFSRALPRSTVCSTGCGLYRSRSLVLPGTDRNQIASAYTSGAAIDFFCARSNASSMRRSVMVKPFSPT